MGQEDSLDEGMATRSSILAWRIPWTEEPGGLQSIGLQRVGGTECLSMHTAVTQCGIIFSVCTPHRPCLVDPWD